MIFVEFNFNLLHYEEGGSSRVSVLEHVAFVEGKMEQVQINIKHIICDIESAYNTIWCKKIPKVYVK